MAYGDPADVARLDDAVIADLRTHLVGHDVCIVMPRDTDQHTVDILARISREVPGVVVIGESNGPMLARAMEAAMTFSAAHTIADTAADAPDWFVADWTVPRPRKPTKALKAPAEVQDAIQAAAQDRRERKRINNLVNVGGHVRECAAAIVLRSAACACGRKS